MRKIRESNDDFFPDAQSLLQDKIRIPDFLHTLVQDNVIERLIRVFGEPRIYIAVENAQPLFHALVDRLLVELDPLDPGPFLLRLSFSPEMYYAG